jgi:hypothetical protein
VLSIWVELIVLYNIILVDGNGNLVAVSWVYDFWANVNGAIVL